MIVGVICSSKCCNKPMERTIKGLLKVQNHQTQKVKKVEYELEVQMEECLTDDSLYYPREWDYYDVKDLDVVVDYDGVINPDDDDNAIGGENRKKNIFAGLQASD